MLFEVPQHASPNMHLEMARLFKTVLNEACDPAVQPSQLSNLGIRYGIQIGQAFGWDFGYGIIKDICFVDFVIV